MSSQGLPQQQQTPETTMEPPSPLDIPLPSSPSQRKSDDIKTENPLNVPEKAANPHLTALTTKKTNLEAKKTNLEAKLAHLQSQRAALIAEATMPSGLAMPADWTDEQRSKQAMDGANAAIKEHIALLHAYNEIKDIGLGLMGLVAEKRQVRVATIMDEFGVDEKD